MFWFLKEPAAGLRGGGGGGRRRKNSSELERRRRRRRKERGRRSAERRRRSPAGAAPRLQPRTVRCEASDARRRRHSRRFAAALGPRLLPAAAPGNRTRLPPRGAGPGRGLHPARGRARSTSSPTWARLRDRRATTPGPVGLPAPVTPAARGSGGDRDVGTGRGSRRVSPSPLLKMAPREAYRRPWFRPASPGSPGVPGRAVRVEGRRVAGRPRALAGAVCSGDPGSALGCSGVASWDRGLGQVWAWGAPPTFGRWVLEGLSRSGDWQVASRSFKET